ncbi:MAG: helix-turn-helix domain-containing protein, partial [archaeon]
MAKYNWQKSNDAFRTFKFIFERGESSLKDIASQFNLDKSTITHHVRGFRNAELIETSYKNREKIHWINREKLAKELRLTGAK